MKYFTTVHDVPSPIGLIEEGIALKNDPFAFSDLGKNKVLGLLFMNPSLRTRLSMQRAAMNLGMQVIVMNINQDGWALEFNDGAVMNSSKQEHVKDAAAVMGLYCDIIAVRSFPSLTNREEDYSEKILLQFMKYCKKPLISLESATLHPLQSLADAMTIKEFQNKTKKPKVVLSWAPHIKPLPQAVANSFAEWIKCTDVDLVITHPKGYELQEDFSKSATICYDQSEALADADFVYVKNWSAYNEYGTMPAVKEDWLLSEQKMSVSNNAYVMHCLPVRRNIELIDELLDGPRSLIHQQAENRIYSAQIVLKKMLEAQFEVTKEKTELLQTQLL